MDRKLGAIYDAIDSCNFKVALKLTQQALKSAQMYEYASSKVSTTSVLVASCVPDLPLVHPGSKKCKPHAWSVQRVSPPAQLREDATSSHEAVQARPARAIRLLGGYIHLLASEAGPGEFETASARRNDGPEACIIE
eukprot:scaffold101_cov373-Prasinococcus_capsulatus_cf.AAC.14